MPIIVGVINTSPESFYSPSVCKSVGEVVKRAEEFVNHGAEIIDVGGMSTAPYRETWVSVEEEMRRVVPAVRKLCELGFEVSIDTTRAEVAKRAVEAGAEIVNAVLPGEEIANVVREYGVRAIVVAREVRWVEDVSSVVSSTISALRRDLELFRGCRTIADPAIGFWRKYGRWYFRDLAVLANLDEIRRAVRRPILVGVSRKSFIGEVTGAKRPEDRLPGSIAAEVLSMPDYVRTHNVKESFQAFRIAELLHAYRLP